MRDTSTTLPNEPEKSKKSTDKKNDDNEVPDNDTFYPPKDSDDAN